MTAAKFKGKDVVVVTDRGSAFFGCTGVLMDAGAGMTDQVQIGSGIVLLCPDQHRPFRPGEDKIEIRTA